MSGYCAGAIIESLLLGSLVELEHGEGLFGAGHLTDTYDYLAAALEDRVQRLVDEYGHRLGGVRIVVVVRMRVEVRIACWL